THSQVPAQVRQSERASCRGTAASQRPEPTAQGIELQACWNFPVASLYGFVLGFLPALAAAWRPASWACTALPARRIVSSAGSPDRDSWPLIVAAPCLRICTCWLRCFDLLKLVLIPVMAARSSTHSARSRIWTALTVGDGVGVDRADSPGSDEPPGSADPSGVDPPLTTPGSIVPEPWIVVAHDATPASSRAEISAAGRRVKRMRANLPRAVGQAEPRRPAHPARLPAGLDGQWDCDQ